MTEIYTWQLNRKVTLENFDLCFIFRAFPNDKPEGSYYDEKKIAKEFEDLALDELEVIATLGMGGFGRVELVTTYALYSLYIVVSRVSSFPLRERDTLEKKLIF